MRFTTRETVTAAERVEAQRQRDRVFLGRCLGALMVGVLAGSILPPLIRPAGGQTAQVVAAVVQAVGVVAVFGTLIALVRYLMRQDGLR